MVLVKKWKKHRWLLVAVEYRPKPLHLADLRQPLTLGPDATFADIRLTGIKLVRQSVGSRGRYFNREYS
jgi:hypothetical protein